MLWKAPSSAEPFFPSFYDVAHTAARKQEAFLNASQENFSPIFMSLARACRDEKVKTTNNSFGTEITQTNSFEIFGSFEIIFTFYSSEETFMSHWKCNTFELSWKLSRERSEQTSAFAFEPLWNVFAEAVQKLFCVAFTVRPGVT